MAWEDAIAEVMNPSPAYGEWYAADSFWRTPISDYTLDPNSATHVAYRTAQTSQVPKFIAGADHSLSEYDYDHPIYWAKSTDPQVTVNLTNDWTPGEGETAIDGDTIYCPANAVPAGGSDHHMAVVQPDGKTYDFWECLGVSGGVLTASWGGASWIDGTGLMSNATAALFALGAGIIRPEELLQGSIDHPLFTVDNYCDGTIRLPAHGGGGRVDAAQTAAGAPPMGSHWFLDISDAEISACPEWSRPVLRACRDYGLITGDTGGGVFKLDTAPDRDGNDRWQPVIDYLGMTKDGDGNAWFDFSTLVDWPTRLHLLAEGN